MLQPRFFPRTQLQPRLPRNPGAPSRAPTSPAGGTPGATCRPRAGASPQTGARGRTRGLPRPFRCPTGGQLVVSAPALPARPRTRPGPPPACRTRWPVPARRPLWLRVPRGARGPSRAAERPGGGAGLPCACAVEAGLVPGPLAPPRAGLPWRRVHALAGAGLAGRLPSWSGQSAGLRWTGSAS